MKKNNYQVAEYIKNLNFDELPLEVIEQTKVCIKDLLGAIIGGSQTSAAKIARDFAKITWQGCEATVITAGKESSCIGATFANAVQANAIDIDDGFRPVKGHPGALIIPAALSVAEKTRSSGKKLLEAIIIGYEVGTRAGIIWHNHYPVYHSSGSWGSMATAAVAAKLLNLNVEQIINALGIAEYQAPIGPMMRCIEYPAMVKDGIGWGSSVGVTSAFMASSGFTGIPSLFGFAKYGEYINTLGREYNILKLYFKPYACCRWAQPAIAAALDLIARYKLTTAQIKKIEISTFAESASLRTTPPLNAEEAQYNLTYPVAVALVDGEVGPRQLVADRLQDPEIISLIKLIEVKHSANFDRKFPARAESELVIITKNNEHYSSGIKQAYGDWDNPLSAEELENKYYWLMGQVNTRAEAEIIAHAVDNLENMENLDRLMALLSGS
jgi:2-methylcitrate dehydratase PrpD